MKSKFDWPKKKRQIAIDSKKFEWFDRAWVSTDAKGAWHSRKYWTVISGTRWFCQFYYIMLCYILGFWGFTSDWHPLFQISNSSPDSRVEYLRCWDFKLFFLTIPWVQFKLKPFQISWSGCVDHPSVEIGVEFWIFDFFLIFIWKKKKI